jgi:hypothetical protein
MTGPGSDVNLRDSGGSTPLMHASAIGSLEAVKRKLAGDGPQAAGG